jgi:hypothetical protein
MRSRKTGAFLLTAALGASLVVGLGQAPAHAFGCESPDVYWSLYTARTLTQNLSNESGTRSVTLRLIQEQVTDMTFARLRGSTRSGDRVWVEYHNPGVSSWTQCPKATIGSSNAGLDSLAVNTGDDDDVYYRACLDYPVYSYRSTICTSSWHDSAG